MGIEVALGVAAAGAIGGIIDGATDDPDQVTTTNSDQTTNSSGSEYSKQSSTQNTNSKQTSTQNTTGTTAEQSQQSSTGQTSQQTAQQGIETQDQVSRKTFDPVSAEEQALRQQSLQNYLQQLALADQYQQGVTGAQGLQDQARANILNLINGQGMAATPEEMALINQRRDAMVAQSSADVNRFIDERLNSLTRDAAARGVRGQALSQLQGDAIRAGADQLGAAVRQADMVAAEQAMQTPYQRISAQSPFLQSGLSLGDLMLQQAQQNRQIAQNPYLLQLLNQERLAGGTTATTGKNTSNTTGTQTGTSVNSTMGSSTGSSSQNSTGTSVGSTSTTGQTNSSSSFNNTSNTKGTTTNVAKGEEGSLAGAITGGIAGITGGASAGGNVMSGAANFKKAFPGGGGGGGLGSLGASDLAASGALV